ncbi:hypothetical protein ACFL03_15405 [Thermodesulfobacteriota bacterium]
MFKSLKYSLSISFHRSWIAIIFPTLIWGFFPLFYAWLPDDIYNDLSVPTFGMLMTTRGIIASVVFYLLLLFTLRKLDASDRSILKRFLLQNWALLVCTSFIGLLFARLFEGIIISKGEVTFAIIFCVALSPFSEVLLGKLYRWFQSRSEQKKNIANELYSKCVEWPTRTAKIHTWLRLVLLIVVIFSYLYAKEGYVLINPVQSIAVEADSGPVASAQVIKKSDKTKDFAVERDPWSGSILSEEGVSYYVIVKPSEWMFLKFFTGCGINLILAFFSAMFLQLFYHLLEVLDARLKNLMDKTRPAVQAIKGNKIRLPAVCAQQAAFWTLATICWGLIWIVGGHDHYRQIVSLLGSPRSVVGWIVGVGLFGTVLCYFCDNLGIGAYSEFAKGANLPVSASKWAGIATTFDPIISLFLVWGFGTAIREHVTVPWMAGIAMFAMVFICLARFNEIATDVFEKDRQQALRARMRAIALGENGVAALQEPEEFLSEYYVLALEGKPFSQAIPRQTTHERFGLFIEGVTHVENPVEKLLHEYFAFQKKQNPGYFTGCAALFCFSQLGLIYDNAEEDGEKAYYVTRSYLKKKSRHKNLIM